MKFTQDKLEAIVLLLECFTEKIAKETIVYCKGGKLTKERTDSYCDEVSKIQRWFFGKLDILELFPNEESRYMSFTMASKFDSRSWRRFMKQKLGI